MAKLTSMKLDPKEAKKEAEIAYEPPAYPWGLCVELNDDALDKLGLDDLPDVEDTMTLTASVVVTGVRSNASKGGESRNLSLQITAMALSSEKADSDGDASDKLYRK